MDQTNDMGKHVSTVKWLLVIGAVGIGAVYLVPILLKLAFDLATIALLGLAGISLFFFLPAFCEALATLGYRLTESVWLADPIAKLRRDLEANRRGLDELENQIATANASVAGLEKLVKEKSRVLTPESLEEKKQMLVTLRQAGVQLVALRDQEKRNNDAFELRIEEAEAELSIRNGFNHALQSFKFAKRVGAQSVGSKVALDSIEKGLAESQSKLALVLSRPGGAIGELTTGGSR